MTCAQLSSVVDRWQEEGTANPEDQAAIDEHLGVCSACHERYAGIVMLMGRDFGAAHTGIDMAPPVSDRFAAQVMARISDNGSGARNRNRRLITLRNPRIAALAAAAILVVVFGIAFQTLRPGRNEVVVHFVLEAPGAERVALAGSFTDWNPNKILMKRDAASSRWEISVPLAKGETYLYNFVIDGKTWIPDPGTEVQVNDGFGGESSLIQL